MYVNIIEGNQEGEYKIKFNIYIFLLLILSFSVNALTLNSGTVINNSIGYEFTFMVDSSMSSITILDTSITITGLSSINIMNTNSSSDGIISFVNIVADKSLKRVSDSVILFESTQYDNDYVATITSGDSVITVNTPITKTICSNMTASYIDAFKQFVGLAGILIMLIIVYKFINFKSEKDFSLDTWDIISIGKAGIIFLIFIIILLGMTKVC